ncbi:MAG: hypothetical protein ACD_45C00630G0008 [uncultured bacterium]|nr:MAG: hypothetical protein ACD_45C00630G0008 [uncultured bacterium]
MGIKKLIWIVLLSIAIIAGIEIFFEALQHNAKTHDVKIDGTYLNEAKNVNQFELSATTGKIFNQENLQGHWTLMFFGFTNCGMVCPTTMAALSGMYKMLQKELPEDKLPQVVMVSVDPSRDSLTRMKEYVTAFDPHFMGARADIAKTVALEKQFYIVAAKIQADGQNKNQYTMNHSAEILLFNPAGRLQAYLDYPPSKEQLAKDYQLIVKKYSKV